MRMFPRWAPALLVAAPFAFVAPAHADKLTLGSDLQENAASSINDKDLIEAHGADTSFWPLIVDGAQFQAPADGQVLSVKVKGTVFKEQGAQDPANLIHFQSLSPAAADGSRQIELTSQDFYLPIDQPNAITTFEPENLCVKEGGSVAFNNIGGFKFGGSLGAPLDHEHYLSGAPFAVFGLSRASTMARFTSDEGTKNGATVSPNTANQRPGAPVGTTSQGKELLMQVIVATGDDRSQSCGGPRRHPDGTLVETGPDPSYMKVVTSGGKPQQPYVTKDRKFTTGVYCGGEANPACAGTATMLIGKRVIAKANFSVPAMATGKIPMRLNKKDFKKLDKAKSKTMKVTLVLTTSFGTYTQALTLKR
jgi:hypothetical protein